jgi:predicted glycoside hydrolase/deacetylase ChbG (UPF0249 family)
MSYDRRRKRVIVNADDYGFSPGVTDGILRAHREGIVTSTTVMANMPGAEESLRRLREAPGLGVGVHLNITQGRPLSGEGAALASGDGVMNRTATEIFLACMRRPRLLSAVEAEFDAQIRWMLDHAVRPTHLDSHRHTHAFWPIFLRVADLARRYGIRFVRWPCERLPGGDWPAASMKQRVVGLTLNWFSVADAVFRPHLRATRGTWGIAQTGCIDAGWLIRAARAVRPGVTEIMTHPGYGDDLLSGTTRLLESRRRELEALCDPAVRDAFARCGVELTHYGRL